MSGPFLKSKVTALRMPAGFGSVWAGLGWAGSWFVGLRLLWWLVGWLAGSTISQVEARDASACGRGGGIQCGEVGEVGWGWYRRLCRRRWEKRAG